MRAECFLGMELQSGSEAPRPAYFSEPRNRVRHLKMSQVRARKPEHTEAVSLSGARQIFMEGKSSGTHESSGCEHWLLIENCRRPIRAGLRVRQACGNRCSWKQSPFRVCESFHTDPHGDTRDTGQNNPRLDALDREPHGKLSKTIQVRIESSGSFREEELDCRGHLTVRGVRRL